MQLLEELVSCQTERGIEGSMLDAVIAERGLEQQLAFGHAALKAAFTQDVPGAVALLQLGWDEEAGVAEALVLASGAKLSFASLEEGRPFADVLALEEGEWTEGMWRRRRRLNGDELQILSCVSPTLLKVRVLLFS